MVRPSTTLRVVMVPALLLAVVAMVACGGGEEKTLLNKYFMASKMGDNLTLANIATVAFDPKIDGQMQTFSIVVAGEPKVTKLDLKAHAEALRKATEEDKAFTEKKKAYQDANADAIDRILKAEQKNQPVKGKDAEIQREWNKFREETAAMSRKVSEVRKAANQDRPIVEISAQDQRNPFDVMAYDVDLATKEVTIEGQVKPETGDAVTKTFVLTLQQATVKGVNGKDVVGRWVITDRKEVAK